LRNPAPFENGGLSPFIYRISHILLVVQDFATIHSIDRLMIPVFCDGESNESDSDDSDAKK